MRPKNESIFPSQTRAVSLKKRKLFCYPRVECTTTCDHDSPLYTDSLKCVQCNDPDIHQFLCDVQTRVNNFTKKEQQSCHSTRGYGPSFRIYRWSFKSVEKNPTIKRRIRKLIDKGMDFLEKETSSQVPDLPVAGTFKSAMSFQGYLADGTKVVIDNKGKGFKGTIKDVENSMQVWLKKNPGARLVS